MKSNHNQFYTHLQKAISTTRIIGITITLTFTATIPIPLNLHAGEV